MEKNVHVNFHGPLSPVLENPSAVAGAVKGFMEADTKAVTPYSGEIDGIFVIGLNQEELAFYSSFTPERRRKLNRKVDIRLIPMLALLYLVSNLDRANIGNAKIEGMETDLSLTGVQYNTALAIFFVSYMLFGTFKFLQKLHVSLSITTFGFSRIAWVLTIGGIGLRWQKYPAMPSSNNSAHRPTTWARALSHSV